MWDAVDEAQLERKLDDRLRAAFLAACVAQRGDGCTRVQIHMGSNVIEHLRAFADKPDPLALGRTCWGFPVVEAPAAFPDRIEVHTVQVIA